MTTTPTPENVPPLGERIQKVIAKAGIASRREAERWITEGRVLKNDEKVVLGDRVLAKDKLTVDGNLVDVRGLSDQDYRVIVYSKPEGVVCSNSDPEGRPTVFDNLPKLKDQRWISVGRLDINTSGLLILTTDGELANRLMHPSYEIDREYAVRVNGDVDDAMLARLKAGVLLEDGIAKFTDVQEFGGDGRNKWFHAVLMGGKNREVRRLWESQEVQVSRLKRVRYGCIFLPSRLKVGVWEELNNKGVNDLRALVSLPPITVKQKSIQEMKDLARSRTKSVNKGVKQGVRSKSRFTKR
ncbi:MAG: 23S rRNA pseudouridine2605 synthase, partial [Oleiphilaceae bacterium]|jgi:23S rRNA pseudouridine2605 synthase